MGFMKWSKEFDLGIPAMDEQHKKWLELLNRFYDSIVGNENFDSEVKKLLDEAYQYTQYHFTEEEKFMAKIGYPAINEQKKMHESIKKTIAEFKNKVDSGGHVMSISLTNELKSWFKQHILVEDKKYASLYQARS